jgi:hypothetical protein
MDEDTPYGHDRRGETQRPNSMDAGTCMASHTWGSHTCGSCGSHASVLHEEGSEGREKKTATLVAKDTKKQLRSDEDYLKVYVSKCFAIHISIHIYIII